MGTYIGKVNKGSKVQIKKLIDIKNLSTIAKVHFSSPEKITKKEIKN